MAIVKMKKLRVMAMADQRENLLKGLLRLGCVEISEPADDAEWAATFKRSTSILTEIRSQIADVNMVLNAIKRFSQKKTGLFAVRTKIAEEIFLGESLVDQAQKICEAIGGRLKELNDLQSDEARLLMRQASLRPWSLLDVPLNLGGTENTVFRIGTCPAGTDTGTLRNFLCDVEAELFEISSDKQQVYYFLIFHRDNETVVQEILRPFGFSVTVFQGLTGTAADNIRVLEEALIKNRKAQEDVAAEIAASSEHISVLQLYVDRLGTEAAKNINAERLVTNGTVLFFEGWVPDEKLGQVSAYLEQSGCAWEALAPMEEEYPDVPVQLKNNWLTRPLNMVTEMYSLPAYNNVDPNPLMAPFFILFYGIMMADMGYGLLMFLAGVIISRRYSPKGTIGHMMGLLQLCGVSTFIMGAITGGFFGDFLTQFVKLSTGADFTLPALFTPLNDTLMILIGAIALGLVQIVSGMAISLIRKLKRGAVIDAVFEEVTWWIVFAGIACMALGITNLVLYAGIAMVVIGPLVTGKGMGKVIGIFSSIYNHVTGYFGDLLSYARLMALMLAGSVIAQVFNTLGAIPGNIIFFLVVSIAGNALNFALNLLGCYVHDLRLQCLEYFGKFYEDGGKPFQPLAFNTKYVDVETR